MSRSMSSSVCTCVPTCKAHTHGCVYVYVEKYICMYVSKYVRMLVHKYVSM